MRVRWYAFLALLVVSASPVQAQASRPFENSWFWGVKAGTVSFATNAESRTVGSIGGDWVITRKTGGLYVSFDIANFVSRLRAEDSNAGGGTRSLEVNDLRRVGVAGMIFPFRYAHLRPYVGIGMSLEMLGDAAVVIDSTDRTSDSPDAAFLSTVDDRRSQVGLMVLGGVQAELARFAAFAQASVVPDAGRFLIGKNPIVALQAGIRFNVGTSIDRPH